MHNLCSKCFRESGKSLKSSAKEDSASTNNKPVQKSISRCFKCQKKVGLTGLKCHCGYVYCSTHRHAEAHDCDYDFRKAERERLEKENPVVAGKKLDKI